MIAEKRIEEIAFGAHFQANQISFVCELSVLDVTGKVTCFEELSRLIYQFSCMITLDKCTHGWFQCMGSILVTNMDFSNKIYHVSFFLHMYPLFFHDTWDFSDLYVHVYINT